MCKLSPRINRKHVRKATSHDILPLPLPQSSEIEYCAWQRLQAKIEKVEREREGGEATKPTGQRSQKATKQVRWKDIDDGTLAYDQQKTLKHTNLRRRRRRCHSRQKHRRPILHDYAHILYGDIGNNRLNQGDSSENDNDSLSALGEADVMINSLNEKDREVLKARLQYRSDDGIRSVASESDLQSVGGTNDAWTMFPCHGMRSVASESDLQSVGGTNDTWTMFPRHGESGLRSVSPSMGCKEPQVPMTPLVPQYPSNRRRRAAAVDTAGPVSAVEDLDCSQVSCNLIGLEALRNLFSAFRRSNEDDNHHNRAVHVPGHVKSAPAPCSYFFEIDAPPLQERRLQLEKDERMLALLEEIF